MVESVVTTGRLTLRKPRATDAQQLVKLFNQADFIANIRDKEIRTEAQAKLEVEETIEQHFAEHGFGLFSMDYQNTSCIGMCGLVKRPALEIPDIGFAILSAYQNQGLVTEASHAIIKYGFEVLELERIAAIVKPDNMASISVISKLGMPFIKGMQIEDDEPQVKYFELSRETYYKRIA